VYVYAERGIAKSLGSLGRQRAVFRNWLSVRQRTWHADEHKL
jgi:hypothetical protein